MNVQELIEELQKLDPEKFVLEVWAYPGCSCYPPQPIEPGFITKEVTEWVGEYPYLSTKDVKKTVLIID